MIETTMTTDKNNFCHLGASVFAKATTDKSAPGFKLAARLRGEEKDVVFTCCFGCFQKNL